MTFQKKLEGLDRERDMEYGRMIKEEAENSAKEEKLKAEERIKMNKAYGLALKNQ